MPPRLPLTPASSTEIAAMDTLSPGCPPGDLALSFALPPAALSSPARKKRGAAEADFDLPPPPTRSRKIIQMKPKEPPTGAEEKSKSAAKSKESGGGGGGGKKKSTASTAAGRKIARKTAHSLIERRRRSKMNEEFATLKDMIPACRGQDMHKLAILQASIEYMNYLEQCVADLKAANASKRRDEALPEWPGASRQAHEQAHSPPSSASTSSSAATTPDTSPAISPSDQQKTTTTTTTTTTTSTFHLFTPPEININTNVNTNIPSTASYDTLPVILPSPSLPAEQHSQHSWSRRPTVDYHPTANPNTLPPLSLNTGTGNSTPAQPPSTRLDHEASAALLMLNSHDRRDETRTQGARKSGISVQDLLSH